MSLDYTDSMEIRLSQIGIENSVAFNFVILDWLGDRLGSGWSVAGIQTKIIL